MPVTALDHVYLETRDRDAGVAFWQGLGFDLADAVGYSVSPEVEVEQPPAVTHWGTRWLRMRDPEGRVFWLEENPEDRPCT